MKNHENHTNQEVKRSEVDPVIDPVIEEPGNAREIGSKPAGLFDRMRGMFSGTHGVKRARILAGLPRLPCSHRDRKAL